MSRALTLRLLGFGFFVACLGGTASGQSSSAKPVQKKAPATTMAPAAAPKDVRIQTSYSSGAQVSTNTMYIKGERQRVEFPGVVSIEQCDAGQTLVLNPAAKTYFVSKHAVASTAAAVSAAQPGADVAQAASSLQDSAAQQPPRGGVVTYTMAVHDTGERKQLFGREARHVTTTVTKTPSATACDKTPLTIETDGWYIDFQPPARCQVASAPRPIAARRIEACVDRVESRVAGDARLGFPLAMTTTTRTGEGDRQDLDTSSMEVKIFEVTTLDAGLFTAPEGFTEVKTNAELMAGYQGGGAGMTDALVGSTADGTSTAAPKRAGAVRIGVLEPVDKSPYNLPYRELRRELTSAFRHNEPYEALMLPGHAVAEARSEAARMECDYVLSVEIADIKTSKPGKVGGLLKKVSRQGPAGDVHEVKLDYRLYAVDSAGASPVFTETVRTSSGGGFGLRSALNLATFAGSLYLGVGRLALMNPMLASSLGSGLGPLASRGLFDPRLRAMSSMSQMFSPAETEAIDGSDSAAGRALTWPADPEIRRTVAAALGEAARGTIGQLKKSTRK